MMEQQAKTPAPRKEETSMYYYLMNLLNDEEGQALTEYGLILALIAVVCILALTTLGLNVQGILNQIAGAV